MTRIAVTSDLHLGITTEEQVRAIRDHIAAEAPDLSVLAGDVGEGLPNFRRCLEIFGSLPGQVAVLAGNHDVWARGGRHSTDLFERALPAAAKDAGALWLEEAEWRHADLAVAGSLSWYDYSAADPGLPPMPSEWYASSKGRYNLDAHLVDWPQSDGEMSARLGDALCARLAALEADPTINSVLVVTHVPLVEQQMCRRPGDQRWGRSNAYFGNLTTGNRAGAFSKVAAIVSGHTHIGRDGAIPHPTNPDNGEIHVSVVPSDYGAPAYVLLDADSDALTVSVCRSSAGQIERVANIARGGVLRASAVFDAMRRKLWPDSQPS